MDMLNRVIAKKLYGGGNSGGGGGGNSGDGSAVASKDVNYYDYDGTILYSYTAAEALALTEAPPLPTQPGLICQEWNVTLEEMQSYVRKYGMRDVGATYITDDGKTRLYITLEHEERMDVPCWFTQSVANGVTVNWGDGSEETFSSIGDQKVAHQYTSPGDYVITFDVAEGCEAALGANSKSITGDNSNLTNPGIYRTMLKKVEIGQRMHLGQLAFAEFQYLESVTLPVGTTVGTQAFWRCISLVCVIFPAGAPFEGLSIFNRCVSLKTAVFAEGMEVWPRMLDDSTALKRITVPESVTRISSYGFYQCYSVENLIIPDSVTSIGEYAVYTLNELPSLALPQSLNTLGSHAIYRAYALTHITIPSGVAVLGQVLTENHALLTVTVEGDITSVGQTFYKCHSLKWVDFTACTSVPPLSTTNGFYGVPEDCEIRVPAALVDEWKAATNWSTYADYIVGV